MAWYEIRLYKPTIHNPNKFEVVNRIPFQASDDAEALVKAPLTQIPVWDDSDWALLFGEDGRTLWRLDRDH